MKRRSKMCAPMLLLLFLFLALAGCGPTAMDGKFDHVHVGEKVLRIEGYTTGHHASSVVVRTETGAVLLIDGDAVLGGEDCPLCAARKNEDQKRLLRGAVCIYGHRPGKENRNKKGDVKWKTNAS